MALKALRDPIGTGQARPVDETALPGYVTHLQHHWLRKMMARRIAAPVMTG